MIDYTGTYTDQYQLTMAQVYFMKGKGGQPAVFDYFFRKLPFNGGYAVYAGLNDLLEILENFHFDSPDIDFLKKQGLKLEFLKYLEKFKFTGTVYSSQEGDVIFPTRPVLSVEANIIEAQIIETLTLNILNFQTLIATKASRMRDAATGRKLVDFGLRRAQGPGGYYASRAAIIGGFDSTSNVRSGRDFNIPVTGTMAHSFIQSYDDELAAFRDFAQERPDDCVLLVDTYDTLKSGVPNAITVGKEMEKQGYSLKGIRLDSGDLAYLSKKSREMMDEAGLEYVKIAVSNQLDEYVIDSLINQKAPIDLFGVGTNLITGQPDAALDGVYKLAVLDQRPRIKLSESISKITIPHLKQVFRLLDDDRGNFYGADAVALMQEETIKTMHHPFEPSKSLFIKPYEKEPLLHKVMENGRRTMDKKSLNDISTYSRSRVNQLPDEYKRLKNPHMYKIGLSDKLKQERDRLIETHT